MKKLMLPVFLIISLSFLYAGGSTENSSDEHEKVQIAVLPDAGMLPLLLMEDVETVPFFSAKERDAAMQAGGLDGMMSDIITAISFTDHGMPMKILTTTESRFVIAAAPDFDAEQDWTIGISENTVIEYLTEQLAAGHPYEQVNIPQIPVRLEMLRNGQISLACLTDAMLWPLLEEGYTIVRDQADTDLTPAILLFSDEFLQEHGDRIPELVRQWNEAVETINANPDAYKSMLNETVGLSGSLNYPMPQYKPVTLPNRENLESVYAWYEEHFDASGNLDLDDIIIKL